MTHGNTNNCRIYNINKTIITQYYINIEYNYIEVKI